MKIKFLLFFAIILLYSCSIQIKGSMKGFSSDYEKEKDNLSISFLKDKKIILDSLDISTIYAINGQNFKSLLKEKTIVYFWSPRCSSSNCVILSEAQRYCNKHEVNLLVVVEYYDSLIIDFVGMSKYPIFSIDHFFYESNYVNKYIKLFQQDIIGNSHKFISGHRFFLFNNKNFIESFDTITRIM